MRKLALAALTATVAMALMATSASAATQVRDSAGNLCSQVSPAINATNANYGSTTRSYASGGCSARMNGGWTIYRSSNGSNPTSCNVAFDARIGGDGWGYAENFTYSCQGASVVQCAGDRLIAPPSYNPPFFGGTLFSSANAATDLNVELCGNSLSTNYWGATSMDITKTSSTFWYWSNQVPPSAAGPLQHFIGGTVTGTTPLTITH